MSARWLLILLVAAAANEVELIEPDEKKVEAPKNETPAELPICKGGCSGLSCAYPRMCRQMIAQYKCQCAECDGKSKVPENKPVGKEHFTRRVVGPPKTRR